MCDINSGNELIELLTLPLEMDCNLRAYEIHTLIGLLLSDAHTNRMTWVTAADLYEEDVHFQTYIGNCEIPEHRCCRR